MGMILLLLIVLVSRQRSILYVPTPPNTQRLTSQNPYSLTSPSRWPGGAMPFEDCMISTPDGVRIHAWLVYQQRTKWINEKGAQVGAPYTFVYFHGNAGNIGHRLENVQHMYAKLGVNILIVDYRGYGESDDGSGPCEKGFMTDAMATYKYFVNELCKKPSTELYLDPDRVLLFGRSIGGAVATQLMAQLLRDKLALVENPPLPLPAGCILENTFTSLRDMAVEVFPFLKVLRPVLRSPIVFDEWKSSNALEYLVRNHEHWCCCMMSGALDEIVPPIQMRQLHDILKQRRPKVLRFFKFPLGGHNDTPTKGGPDYWKSFEDYMKQVKESEPERLAANGTTSQDSK